MRDHQFESQALRKVTVPLAVSRTDKTMQFLPATTLFCLGFNSGLLFLYALFGRRIFFQLVFETGFRLLNGLAWN